MSTIAEPPEVGSPIESTLIPPPKLARDCDDSLDHYEIVDGVRVETPPMGAYQSMLANVLTKQINLFDPRDELGHVVIEVLFRFKIPAGMRSRRPDAAFVSFDRWPIDKPLDQEKEAWDVVPDLAIEVVSPSNIAYDVETKLVEYFEAGVKLVWIVYPHVKRFYVHESLTSVRVLSSEDVLDGGAVLPGFRLPLKNIFRGMTLEE